MRDEEGQVRFAHGIQLGAVGESGRVGLEIVVIRDTAPGGLTPADWFTPDNWSHLNDLDNDLGSCGPILTSSGWVIGGGKEGIVFLMDQNNLGHTQTGNNQILQHFQAIGYGIFNLAFWDRPASPVLYLRADGDVAKAFEIVNGQFQTKPMSQAAFRAGLPYDGMAISANGSVANSGILWLTSTKDGDQNGAGTLHAFNALNLSRELWNSDMNAARNGWEYWPSTRRRRSPTARSMWLRSRAASWSTACSRRKP